MRKQKHYLCLDPQEVSIVIQSLNQLRNDYLAQDFDTDDVDALLIKVMSAPTKKF